MSKHNFCLVLGIFLTFCVSGCHQKEPEVSVSDLVKLASQKNKGEFIRLAIPIVEKEAVKNPRAMREFLEKMTDLATTHNVISAIQLEKYANEELAKRSREHRQEVQKEAEKTRQKELEIQSLAERIKTLEIEKTELSKSLEKFTMAKLSSVPVFCKNTWDNTKAYIKIIDESNSDSFWTVELGAAIKMDGLSSNFTLKIPPGKYIVEFYVNDFSNLYMSSPLIVTDRPSYQDKYHGFVLTPLR